jgi:spore maturation protein CgeB
LSVPVVSFLQASAFVADGAEGPSETEGAVAPTDVVFVGNSRGVMRNAVQWSIDRGLALSVYGSGWDDRIPDALVIAEYVPNERLAATYRGASIVLNDHWPGMAAAGFISNRVFDALAAGGFVLSDPVAGLEDVFGDTVPIYRDAEELERLVERYREHPDERAELAARGRAIVAEEHSFARRARQFIDLVTPYLHDRRPTIVGTRWADTGTGVRSVPDAQPDAERRDLA